MIKDKLMADKYLPVVATGLNNIRKEAKMIYDVLSQADMQNDIAVSGYLKRLTKMAFQSLDICNEMDRQGRFLANASKTAALRKRVELARKEMENKRNARNKTEETYGND